MLVRLLVHLALASSAPTILHNRDQSVLRRPTPSNRTITPELFVELEELSRVVDITYCVGTLNTGISPPFTCLSFCSDFPTFELVQTWNTGITFSDSCGYIALSHPPSPRRILVAFRGTYSITNALIDLSAAQQEYLPYPSDGHSISRDKCENCGVHRGFLESWSRTERIISPAIEALIAQYPDYQLTLVGHSLGGAVAALAGLDFHGRGWAPTVTTFGEPRVGNRPLAKFFNKRFTNETYRRVTHADDPVPLVPLDSMGYSPHAHEIFIAKPDLPQEMEDVRQCEGEEDSSCSAGGSFSVLRALHAHRDYLHRLGLCLPRDSFFHKFNAGELREGGDGYVH